MDLQHSFSVPIPIGQAWDAFNDLERIAPCFPGAQITSVDGDEFTGTAKVKLGPIALQYTGTGRWLERDRDGYRAVIEANGKDRRGNGTAGAVITAHLEEEPGGTRVVVDTRLKVTGRPAQFGRGVMQDVGNKLLDQFAACLSTRLGEGSLGAEAASDETPAELPPDQEADQTNSQQEQEGVAAQQPAAGTTEPDDGVVSEPVVAGRTAPAHDTGSPVQSSAAPSTGAPSTRAASTRAGSASPPLRSVPPPPDTPDELDVGSLLGPVILRRFGPALAGVAAAALLLWVVRRRR